MDLAGAEALEAGDLGGLIVGLDVEVEAARVLYALDLDVEVAGGGVEDGVAVASPSEAMPRAALQKLAAVSGAVSWQSMMNPARRLRCMPR